MKKIVGIFLVVLMLCAFFSVCAFADSTAHTELKVTPSATSVSVGDTFTVTVSIEGTTGFEGLSFKLDFDSAHYEYVSYKELHTYAAGMGAPPP